MAHNVLILLYNGRYSIHIIMYNTYGYYKTAVAEMLHYLVLFEDKHHKLFIPH